MDGKQESFSPRPPPIPSTSARRGRPRLDTNFPLFELTGSEFAPQEPPVDRLHRPVERVRVWEHHGDKDDGAFAPNLYHVVGQLNDCESFRVRRPNQFAEFDNEMKLADARCTLLRRGVSLRKLVREPHPPYPELQPPRRFAAVNEILRRMPAQVSGTPPVRHIRFVQPVHSRPPERVDFVSRISLAEPQRVKLKRIMQRSQKQELQFQNEMIGFLNHTNERRLRASEQFFDDMAKHGLRHAEAHAKRSAQRSRLRVRGTVDWWGDFIEFAFTGRVGRDEEKFILVIARRPTMTFRQYYETLRQLEEAPDKNARCIEMLKWINAQCNCADEGIIEILKADEARSRRAASPRART
jgi:hypothetical protein